MCVCGWGGSGGERGGGGGGGGGQLIGTHPCWLPRIRLCRSTAWYGDRVALTTRTRVRPRTGTRTGTFIFRGGSSLGAADCGDPDGGAVFTTQKRRRRSAGGGAEGPNSDGGGSRSSEERLARRSRAVPGPGLVKNERTEANKNREKNEKKRGRKK